MAIKIDGNWSAGFAIDLHTISSVYLGIDDYGRKQFDNERSEIGELVNKLKYHSDMTVIPKIIEIINKNIKNINHVDFIIPVPPSNMSRNIQPVYSITRALSQSTNVLSLENLLAKTNPEQLKNIEDPTQRETILRSSLILNNQIDISNKKVLLVDDVYRSGATLRAITDLLYNQGRVSNVYVLTMTKTRSNR